jgi:hypothetical protein
MYQQGEMGPKVIKLKNEAFDEIFSNLCELLCKLWMLKLQLSSQM